MENFFHQQLSDRKAETAAAVVALRLPEGGCPVIQVGSSGVIIGINGGTHADYDNGCIAGISNDESVVAVNIKKRGKSGLWLYVSPVAPGTTSVYVKTTDGRVRSNECAVTVI